MNRLDRERIEAVEARTVRERLEKNSCGMGRANVLGTVAALAAVDALAGRSLEGTLTGLRKMAQASRTYTPTDPTWAEPGYKQFIPGKTRTAPDGSDDARNEQFVSELRAGRVRDADGKITGDAATRADHWASGRVEPIEPDARIMTVETMRVLAAARAMAHRYW
jgi:hypothetical protein